MLSYSQFNMCSYPGKKKLMVENGRDQPLNGVSIYILRRWPSLDSFTVSIYLSKLQSLFLFKSKLKLDQKDCQAH